MDSSENSRWKCVYSLDTTRSLISGSESELAAAIRRGADLRIYTEFRHDEHIDPTSHNSEVVQEVADFRVTYLMADRWSAGIMTLRQPIRPPDGFGPRPSMSFFLYNQNGLQAIARPYLDGHSANSMLSAALIDDHRSNPKLHQFDMWDNNTNAPSGNFIYDFNVFRFCVNDEWVEVLSHSADGTILSGSLDVLREEFAKGREVKVGIGSLCSDLASDCAGVIEHEVFVQVGSCYYYTESKQFMAASQPVVRVRPAIPIRYESQGWDFGWLMVRADGLVAKWLVDPYTLAFRKSNGHHAIRWFVR